MKTAVYSEVLWSTRPQPLTNLCAALGLFGVREHVGLEIGGLGEAFATVVKGAHVWSVSSVDPDVSAEVEVQREPLTTPLKGTLRRRRYREKVCNYNYIPSCLRNTTLK